MNGYQWIAIACGGLCALTADAQTLIEGFEYASEADLVSAWTPSGGAAITLSDSVSSHSTGKKSMRVDFNFTSREWSAESIGGVDLPAPLSIAPSQYLTLRLRGDLRFAAADFRNLYLYVYDVNGNFARYLVGPTPLVDEWQVVNVKADALQLPWESTTFPDLRHISRFAFFQIGSQAAIAPYSATVYIDDLMVRDTPLIEFPPPAAPRALLDDFEGYADDAALKTFYSYQNGPAATVTTISLASPAPQEAKALKLAIDFAAGEWSSGSVWSKLVTPFSIPTNAVVSFRFKGDPALAAVADTGTVFRLSFADKAGGHIDVFTGSAPVVSSHWTTIESPVANLGNLETVDIGNIVQWQMLVEGWKGTAATPALSGVFYVDDVKITMSATQKPQLNLIREGGNLTLNLATLTPGAAYELRTCTDLFQWSTATVINATANTATWTVTPNPTSSFFQLIQKQ